MSLYDIFLVELLLKKVNKELVTKLFGTSPWLIKSKSHLTDMYSFFLSLISQGQHKFVTQNHIRDLVVMVKVDVLNNLYV